MTLVGWRRRAVLAAVVGMVIVGTGIATAPAAGAAPIVGDCNKSAPAVQRPDDGLSGLIDSGPSQPTNDTVYTRFARTPPWHTYDTGCVPDVGASIDTTIGNWLMGGASVIVAATDGLHRVVSPPTFFDKLDPLLEKGTAGLGGGLYLPWLPLSVLVLGIFILWIARRQEHHRAVHGVAWALLVLGLAGAALAYPVRAGHLADGVATSTVGQINQAMLGEGSSTTDPASARGSLLTDTVMYRNWCRGELGSDTSALAKEYCPKLLAAQAFPIDNLPYWDNFAAYEAVKAFAGQDTNASVADLAKIKQVAGEWDQHASCKQYGGCYEFTDLAKEIQSKNPSAYKNLTGQGVSRIGLGATALISALLVAPFLLVADLLIIMGLLVLRLVVIAFPAIAVYGLHERGRPLVKGAGMLALTGLINLVVFAALAAVDMLGVGMLLSPDLGLPWWLALVLAGLLTFVLWKVSHPFRKMHAMVGQATGASRGAGGTALRWLAAFELGKWGARRGAREAIEEQEEPASVDLPRRVEADGESQAGVGFQAHAESRPASAPVWLRRTPEPPQPEPIAEDTTPALPAAPPRQFGPWTEPLALPAANGVRASSNGHHNGEGRVLRLGPGGAGSEALSPPGPAQMPEAATPRVLPRGEGPQVSAANQVVDEQGRPVYRLWNPDTGGYERVTEQGFRLYNEYEKALAEGDSMRAMRIARGDFDA